MLDREIVLTGKGPDKTAQNPAAGIAWVERQRVMPIDRDRLLEQPESRENPLFRYRIESRKRTQIEIVGGEVGRWPRGRISAACNAGSITPATLIATLSCRSNTPSSDLRSRLPLEGDRP